MKPRARAIHFCYSNHHIILKYLKYFDVHIWKWFWTQKIHHEVKLFQLNFILQIYSSKYFRIFNFCAPFEKLELAFRNQLAQTNGVLFRRPRGTSENRITLANRTIEGDLLMVRCHYSRGTGKWRHSFASLDYRTIFVAQNRIKSSCGWWCRNLIIFKKF